MQQKLKYINENIPIFQDFLKVIATRLTKNCHNPMRNCNTHYEKLMKIRKYSTDTAKHFNVIRFFKLSKINNFWQVTDKNQLQHVSRKADENKKVSNRYFRTHINVVHMPKTFRMLLMLTLFWLNKQLENNCDNCNKNSSICMKTSLFLKISKKIIATRIVTNCDKPVEIATNIMKDWWKLESNQPILSNNIYMWCIALTF